MSPSSKPKASSAALTPDRTLRDVDAIFETAGLVRNLRGKSGGVSDRPLQNRVTPEELSHAAPLPILASNGVSVLKIPAWDKLGGQRSPWLWHGFSTRKGGVSRAYCAEDSPGELNLGFTGADDREAVSRNRQSPRKGDGLMTAEPGILLGVQTADCIPVLVADRKRHVVAAFHAGWRGTVKRIVESGIGRMRLEYGSRPEDLTAAIGPGASVCCYAVGDEVLSSFESQFAYASELFREVYDADPVRTKYPMLFLSQRAPGHSPIGPSVHVDLIEANRRQLLDAGLKPQSIHTTGGCTNCHRELFFSHRASQGHAGRMMSVIGIRAR